MQLSEAYKNFINEVSKASRVDAPILITGEISTGKSQTALAIHRSSERRENKFVTIDCIGLSDLDFKEQLLGSQSESLDMDNRGALFLAERGTLFLRNVTELSRTSQADLVRCLSSQRFSPLGYSGDYPFDVRIIASTTADILGLIRAGAFRNDLYHIISNVILNAPTLNDRKQDIERLSQNVLRELTGDTSVQLSGEALGYLENHIFTGNLRELRNILMRGVSSLSSSREPIIGGKQIEQAISNAQVPGSLNQPALNNLGREVGSEVEGLASEEGASLLIQNRNEGRWIGDDEADSAMHSSNESEELITAIESKSPIEESSSTSEFSLPNEAFSTENKAQPSELNPKQEKKSAFLSLKDQERAYWKNLLEKCDGDKKSAAKIAGVTLRTLYRRLEDL